MKSVAEMEAKGGTDFMRRIGNQVKKVRLYIIAVFFIGDEKSRACDYPQAGECSNTEREFVFLLLIQKMEETYQKYLSSDVDIAKQVTIDLQKMSQHSIELATNLLFFGGDKSSGIFFAHPLDLMHSFLERIVKYALCAFLKPLVLQKLLAFMMPLMKCLDQAT
jgi:hypothetical protein